MMGRVDPGVEDNGSCSRSDRFGSEDRDVIQDGFDHRSRLEHLEDVRCEGRRWCGCVSKRQGMVRAAKTQEENTKTRRERSTNWIWRMFSFVTVLGLCVIT
jgi:hypothetical protein